MPLGSRELLMIVRARDVASRVLREVGTNVGFIGQQGALTGQQLMNAGAALTGVGVALGAAGALGLSFFNDATDAAIEYNREAAKTKTQVDDVGVSVKQLADIGRNVAREIPAPFDQMQESLYDIFSSMDVNVMQAQGLLAGFSKAAVAGQVDVQVAARSTISILNAYRRPVGDVNKLMDIQFQLVRKGVGTYDEFNSSLGRAIPAAVSAGQEFETLAGMMAFLTRNGLSTQMAATSAARAMELFSDPKRFKALEDLGITVRDSSGKFLQMNDIVTQLANNEGWARMAEPKRKEMFQEIFGRGSIQARRFFDTAIPNFEQLNGLTESMYNSTGALESAYGTMFDEPAMKAQLLQNRYQILKTEIGDQLIPIKVKLMEHVLDLMDKWNGLDEGTRELIVKIAVLGSTFLLVAGVILTVVGAFAMVAGALMTLGLSLGGAIAVMTIVPIVIAAIIAAIVLLVIHWDTVTDAIQRAWQWFLNLDTVWQVLIGAAAVLTAVLIAIAVPFIGVIAIIAAVVAAGYALYRNWDTVKQMASDLWQTMQDFWDWLTQNAVSVWQTVSGAVTDAWGAVLRAGQTLWGWFNTAWQWFYSKFGAGFMRIWNTIWKEAGDIFKELGETIGPVLNYVSTAFTVFWSVVEPILTSFVGFIVQVVWPQIQMVFSFIVMALEVLWQAFLITFNTITAIVEIGIGVIVALWDNFGSTLIDLVVAAWNFISSIVSAAITFVSNFIQLGLNIIQGDWGEAWNNIKDMFGAAWDAIWAALQYTWALIKIFFVNLPRNIIGFIGDVGSLLWQKGWDILNGMLNGLKNIMITVGSWLMDVPGKIKDFFAGAIDWLWNAGYDVLKGLLQGMKAAWNAAVDWLGSLPGKIIDLKGPPARDRTLLYRNGQLIMEGLKTGMQSGWREVEHYLSSVSPMVDSSFKANINADDYFGRRPPGAPSDQGPSGQQIGIYVENLNVSDENITNDLDWWYTTTGSGV